MFGTMFGIHGSLDLSIVDLMEFWIYLWSIFDGIWIHGIIYVCISIVGMCLEAIKQTMFFGYILIPVV